MLIAFLNMGYLLCLVEQNRNKSQAIKTKEEAYQGAKS
jgi:hypothetical protein